MSERYGALFMVVVAMLCVAYLGTMLANEQAQGALISTVSAGVGFYLRGKVEAPK